MKRTLFIYIATLLFPLAAMSQSTQPSPLGATGVFTDTTKCGIDPTKGREFPLSTQGKEGAFTLDQCLDMARTNNRSLQNAALEVKAATEQKKEAWDNYLPQISANVAAFQAFDKFIKMNVKVPSSVALLGEPFSNFANMSILSSKELNSGYMLNMSAIQPLYAGNKIRVGNKLARVGQDVAYLQQNLQEKEVIQKVTECFWQLACIKYNLRTIEAAEKQMEAVMKQVTLVVETGVVTKNVILQTKLHQHDIASNRLQLENAEQLLTMLLSQQIGLTDCENFTIALPAEDETPLPTHVDAKSAASNRIEYQLANKGVEAQQLQVKMEVGNNLPTLAAGVMGYHVGLGGMSSGMKSLMNNKMTNGIALATLSVPISSWIGGTHAIRRQKLKLEQSKNTLLDAQEQLSIDIESSWLSLVEAHKQIEIAKASVEEAAENLRMSMEQFKVGSITLTDLLDAETLNRKAQDQLSTAKATYHIRLADYQRKTE